MMKTKDFAAFILTHGRSDRVHTYNSLKKAGYSGKIYIIIDNEDKTADDYYKRFGDQVIMFDKKATASTFDEGDNFEDRRTIVYARNACFKIAEELGIKYFIELDDDYTIFAYKYDNNDTFKQNGIKSIDKIFDILISYLKLIAAKSIAFIQNGDLIGGGDNSHLRNNDYPFKKRKAMNTFICMTERPFKFIGRINEDVNTYTRQGSIGDIFMTIPRISINQITTQNNSGGMTDVYLDSGTYIKSFYTVMYHPSGTRIKMMGETHRRLHHSIKWMNTVPIILDESYKKQ